MQVSLKTHSCNINLNAESWKCEDQQNSHVQSLQWSSDFLRPFFCLREIRKCQWSNMFSSPAWLASVKVSWDSKRITICHGVGISSWHIFGIAWFHMRKAAYDDQTKNNYSQKMSYIIYQTYSRKNSSGRSGLESEVFKIFIEVIATNPWSKMVSTGAIPKHLWFLFVFLNTHDILASWGFKFKVSQLYTVNRAKWRPGVPWCPHVAPRRFVPISPDNPGF